MYRDMMYAILCALFFLAIFIYLEKILRKLTVEETLEWMIRDTHAKKDFKEPTIKIESVK
jgi:hypothetical protein